MAAAEAFAIIQACWGAHDLTGDSLRRSKRVDQPLSAGRTETGHEIESLYRRIEATLSAHHVVKHPDILRAVHGQIVECGIEKPDWLLAVGHRLLIDERHEAGPHR